MCSILRFHSILWGKGECMTINHKLNYNNFTWERGDQFLFHWTLSYLSIWLRHLSLEYPLFERRKLYLVLYPSFMQATLHQLTINLEYLILHVQNLIPTYHSWVLITVNQRKIMQTNQSNLKYLIEMSWSTNVHHLRSPKWSFFNQIHE